MSDIKYPVRHLIRHAVPAVLDSDGVCVMSCDVDVHGDAHRIAACLNACRDISTEDLELCGEDAFNRNWNLRQFAQYAMFNSGESAKGE